MTKNNKIDPISFNKCFPVTAIEVYKNGTVRVVRDNELQGEYQSPQRGKIRVLSSKSRARLALIAMECEYELETMITLTYSPDLPVTGRESKSHLDKFLRGMKRTFGGFQYLWFMEFSRAGGIHYHVLTSFGEPDRFARECMASIWVASRDLEDWRYSSLKTKKEHSLSSAVWSVHSHEKSWQKLRKKDGAKRYALKYSLKTYQKVVPEMYRDIGRFWGTTRAMARIPYKRVNMSEEVLRSFVEIHCERLKDWDILPEIIFNCFT